MKRKRLNEAAAVPRKSRNTSRRRVAVSVTLRKNGSGVFERMPNSALAGHANQPLSKHRAQSALRNQQQSMLRSRLYSYPIRRTVPEDKLRASAKDGLQLPLSGLKPVQEGA